MARTRLGRVLASFALVVTLLATTGCSVVYEMSTGPMTAADVRNRVKKVEGVHEAHFEYENKELESSIEGTVALDDIPVREWNRVIQEVNGVINRTTSMPVSLRVGRPNLNIGFKVTPRLVDLNDGLQKAARMKDDVGGNFSLYIDQGSWYLGTEDIPESVSGLAHSAAFHDVMKTFKQVDLETKSDFEVLCTDSCPAAMDVVEDLGKIEGLDIPVQTRVSSSDGVSILLEGYPRDLSPRHPRVIDAATTIFVAVRNSKYKPDVTVRGMHEGESEEYRFSWEEGQSVPKSSVSNSGDPSVLDKYLESIEAKS